MSARRGHRTVRRALMAVLVGTAAGGAVLASAASLGVNGRTLGAGRTVVASCDTNGVNLFYNTTFHAPSGSYRIASVTVRNISGACIGARMSLTLRDSANAALGSGTVFPLVPVGGNATVTMTPQPAASAVTGAAVVIAR